MTSHAIILASNSQARKTMLDNAGVPYDAIPANINEDSVQNDTAFTPAEIALKLAQEKALSVSEQHPNALVIGSDQVLSCEGRIFSKAKNIDEACVKLNALNGKTHQLISSVAVAKNNEIVWDHTDTAALTMHDMDDTFLSHYLSIAGDALTQCVGSYALEEKGIWLFETIDGDYFTILGMPLLPLLGYLRASRTEGDTK